MTFSANHTFDDITNSDITSETVSTDSSYSSEESLSGGAELIFQDDDPERELYSDEELIRKQNQFLAHSPGRRKAYRVRRRSSNRPNRRSYVISHITVRVQ